MSTVLRTERVGGDIHPAVIDARRKSKTGIIVSGGHFLCDVIECRWYHVTAVGQRNSYAVPPAGRKHHFSMSSAYQRLQLRLILKYNVASYFSQRPIRFILESGKRGVHPDRKKSSKMQICMRRPSTNSKFPTCFRKHLTPHATKSLRPPPLTRLINKLSEA